MKIFYSIININFILVRVSPYWIPLMENVAILDTLLDDFDMDLVLLSKVQLINDQYLIPLF